ncbi:ribbon-helix-helix domain-containing protein [Neorhizobium petrolearium]|uniref:ribbon-helix-helix domain-containing protein n=1 Tax=Neorhizobium petrolearium TaxID=515361 RepID=UPI003F172EC7
MAEAVKVTVTLEPDIEEYVDAMVKHGAAASTEDYVNTVLRERYEKDLQEFLDALDEGIEDAEAGRFTSVEEAFEMIRRELGFEKGTA